MQNQSNLLKKEHQQLCHEKYNSSDSKHQTTEMTQGSCKGLGHKRKVEQNKNINKGASIEIAAKTKKKLSWGINLL